MWRTVRSALGMVGAPLAALFAVLLAAAPAPVAAQADDLLTVHIIPHSHCDPGWLNTFEGYYVSEVKTVLDAVLRELQGSGHEHRRFVWSEISFFNRWYESLPSESKTAFQGLVSRGQIEFVNGGWVQNDEANPDPVSMIAQMTTGHEYIQKNFGVSPRIAWQIDPFGHSSVTPSLWSLMGFEALVINRIHHSVKDAFKQSRQMEFHWRGADVGQKADMFTHVLHTHYSAPQGFDWEEGAMGVEAHNVQHRAHELSNIMHARAGAFRTRHLLVPFGDDFKFKAADRQFGNMDKIIAYVNSNPSAYRMRIQYSTLSDYFSAVAAANVPFPVIQGDFFPYADNEDSYWTGYYTTRPLLKAKSRKLAHILRACEALLVLVRSSPHSNKDSEQQQLPLEFWEKQFRAVEQARMETSLFLHHDAITGTSRTNVVADYQQRMDQAAEQLSQIMARMVEHLVTREPFPAPQLSPDSLVFAPPEDGTNDAWHPVVYFNSLAWVRREVMSVRVASRNTRIYDSTGVEVACQIDAHWRDLGQNELAPLQSEFLVSFIVEVPALGISTYFVRIGAGSASASPPEPNLATQSESVVYLPAERARRAARDNPSKYTRYEPYNAKDQFIENSFLRVLFDQDTGMMREVVDKKQKQDGSETSFPFKQSFTQYRTSRSGAYIFRPTGRAERLTNNGLQPVIRVTRGPITSSVRTQFRNIDVVTQLFGGTDETDAALAGHVSVQSTLGVDGANTELIAMFEHGDLAEQAQGTEHRFQTHSGLDFMTRTTKAGGNIAANFYPMVLGARVTSARANSATSRVPPSSFTIWSGHSMAAGSNGDGELELMVHRSLAQDDGRGLAEPVNDPSRLEVPLWIAFSGATHTGATHTGATPDFDFKLRSIRLNNPLRSFLKMPSPSPAASAAARDRGEVFMKDDHVTSVAAWRERQHPIVSPLKAPLPPAVHLLSLMVRDSVSDDVVVRFQHLDGRADSGWVSSLADLFEDTFAVSEVRRAALSLNTMMPLGATRLHKSMKFAKLPNAAQSPYDAAPAAGGAGGATDSQNTQEEGVFISQAALEKMRQDQAAQQQAAAAGRRLLEQQEREADLVDVRTSLSMETPSSSRALLQDGAVARASSSSAPLFALKPLQLATFVFRLRGSDWAERQSGVMVGIGERSDGTEPLPTPVRTVPSAPTTVPEAQLPDAPAAGVARPSVSVVGGAGPSSPPTDGSILQGHEHTVLPDHGREAWRLIPSRVEYFVVLLASLLGVAFFLQALRVLARGAADRPGRYKQATH